MAINNYQQEITEALKDEAFIKEVFDQDTTEGVKSVFAKKNIDLSDDEVNDFVDQVVAMSENKEDLSEADLENVSGGLFDPFTVAIIATAVGFGLAKLRQIKKNRR